MNCTSLRPNKPRRRRTFQRSPNRSNNFRMKTTLDALVHALREELQHYGELLARLDEEQECVLRRAPDDLLSAVDAIQEQSTAVQAARSYREDCRKQLVAELGLAQNSSFTQLVHILPHDY